MKRLLVKFGTKSLMGRKGRLSRAIFDEIARQIASLMDDGWQVAIVTSGAIQAGKEEAAKKSVLLNKLHKKDMAAIGTPLLMQMWSKAFARQGICVGQIWLTHANLSHRGEARSIQESIENLLSSGIVPILNENDVVSDREIRSMERGISENDRLTYLLCAIANPDVVLSVTSIGGVFDRFPLSRDSKLYLELDIDNLPVGLLDSDGKTDVGSGGMVKKILELSGCCHEDRRVGIVGWENEAILRFVTGETAGTLLGHQNRLSE
jgi:glutamate 5-kinase